LQLAVQNRKKLILIAGFIIILTLLLDSVLGVSYLYSYEDRSSKFTYSYLSMVYIMNIAAQFLLIYAVGKMHISGKMLKSKALNSFIVLMLISLTVLGSCIFFLVNDMFKNNNYNPFILTFITSYELAISMIMIGALILILFLWFKRKRNVTVFLFMTVFAVLLLTTISASVTLIQELQDRTAYVSPEPNPFDISSIHKSFFFDIYRIGSLISFALVWLVTSLLLKNYTRMHQNKIGWLKFWLLASLPLLYYVFSIDLVINNLVRYIFEYPLLRNLIIYVFSGTRQVGGFFFALSFFFMARSVQNTNLKNYLVLSGVAIMMLFSSLQVTILYLLPYPPFGLITLSVMPISYYLLLIGLYNSARSISYDKELLHNLAKHIRMQPDSFLSGIGSTEWSQNIQTTVNHVMKYNVDPHEAQDVNSDLSPENIRKYVLEVVREIKEKKSS
jgi:hypothetical protein